MVVRLTAAAVVQLMRRVVWMRNSHTDDPQLCEAEFSCYDHSFFGSLTQLGDEEWLVSKDVEIDDKHAARIEIPQLKLRMSPEMSGKWSVKLSFNGVPKHTDTTISSVEIDSGELLRRYEELRQRFEPSRGLGISGNLPQVNGQPSSAVHKHRKRNMQKKRFVIEQYEIHSREVYLDGTTPEEAVADYICGRQPGLQPKSATFVGIDTNHGCMGEDGDPVLAALANQVQDYGVRLTRDGMLESIVNIRRCVMVMGKSPLIAPDTSEPIYWNESTRKWVTLDQATLYNDVDHDKQDGFRWDAIQVRLDDPRLQLLDAGAAVESAAEPAEEPPASNKPQQLATLAARIAKFESAIKSAQRDLSRLYRASILLHSTQANPGEVREIWECDACSELFMVFKHSELGTSRRWRSCRCQQLDKPATATLLAVYE